MELRLKSSRKTWHAFRVLAKSKQLFFCPYCARTFKPVKIWNVLNALNVFQAASTENYWIHLFEKENKLSTSNRFFLIMTIWKKNHFMLQLYKKVIKFLEISRKRESHGFELLIFILRNFTFNIALSKKGKFLTFVLCHYFYFSYFLYTISFFLDFRLSSIKVCGMRKWIFN